MNRLRPSCPASFIVVIGPSSLSSSLLHVFVLYPPVVPYPPPHMPVCCSFRSYLRAAYRAIPTSGRRMIPEAELDREMRSEARETTDIYQVSWVTMYWYVVYYHILLRAFHKILAFASVRRRQITLSLIPSRELHSKAMKYIIVCATDWKPTSMPNTIIISDNTVKKVYRNECHLSISFLCTRYGIDNGGFLLDIFMLANRDTKKTNGQEKSIHHL